MSRPINSTSVVYVPQGSIAQIITYLGEKNFNLYPQVDKYLMLLIGRPQSGWVDIGVQNITRGDFLYKVSHSKAALRPLTLVPGETTEIFFMQIQKDFGLDLTLLKKEYAHLSPEIEGFIVPETYYLPIGISEKHIIHFLVSHAKRYHKVMSEKIFGEYNTIKWHKFLVIASIIQKEAANNEEMPLISSVIYNRLKKDMKLQMDGTLNYGKNSHVAVTPKMIREDISSYNTYLHKGIPPSAICVVGKEAILAAIFPKNTPYLYFVKGKNGKHTFSQTYEGHLQNFNK